MRRARPLLGTLVEIRAAGAATNLAPALDAAFAAIERIQRLMSFHDPESDLSRLNREAHRHPVQVAQDTWNLLAAAARFSEASDGAFDVTIGRQLVAWGYLPRHADAPNDRSAHADYRDVALLSERYVRFAKPLLIDLGGIAKGFAVDRACEALESRGIDVYVVNAGGDLRVGSMAETVHVRHPAEPGRLLPLTVLANGAVATSAGYFAAKLQDGAPVQPLVVPATGAAATTTASISVIASDCMTCDALTKVVALLEDAAAPILSRFDAEACIIGQDSNYRLVGANAGRAAQGHPRPTEAAWN